MAGLAIGSELDESAPALFGLGQRRSAKAEPRGCEALEPAQPNIVEVSAPLVQLGAVVILE
jgi:hypothetical protein